MYTHSMTVHSIQSVLLIIMSENNNGLNFILDKY